MATNWVRRCVIVCIFVGAMSRIAMGQAPSAAVVNQGPGQQHPEALPAAQAVSISDSAPTTYHLTLDEAHMRALQNSVVMEMASQNIAAKCHALDAAQKDFLPKLLNSFSYYHFDSDLGTVVTTPGIFNPVTAISVPVIQQDSTIYTAAAIQPITQLLKVRDAVTISEVDVATAQAQKQFARREISKGVEQLYIGLFLVQRMRAGLGQAAAATQQMIDATKSNDSKIALVQIQQNIVAVDNQATNLKEQLLQFVDLPPGTELVLDPPPEPQMSYACADDVVNEALAMSPKIREAKLQVEKAEAAVRLAKDDFVPAVTAYGFYVNQNATPTIQNDFTGVGVSASYLLEWGKKKDTLRQWEATECLARKNLRKEIQDLQLNAVKAYHEANRAHDALTYADKLAELNREAKLPADPFQLKFALKDRLESEIGAIKADLEYRNAVVELCSITGHVD